MTLNDYYSSKRIWLTGASSGIGRELAILLAGYGANLALTARNKSGLDSLKAEISPADHLLVTLDVTERKNNRDAIDAIAGAWGGLDIAIFNAGTAVYVDIENFDSEIFEHNMRTNFFSMVYGIEAALPLLLKSKAPQVVGVSSAVAWGGIPRAEAYGASKAAIRNMLQALRPHLKHKGVKVSTVCPGFVKTPLTDKNDFPMPLRIDASSAAEHIAKGIMQQKAEISFPKSFSIPYKLLSMLPAGLYTKLMEYTVRAS